MEKVNENFCALPDILNLTYSKEALWLITCGNILFKRMCVTHESF